MPGGETCVQREGAIKDADTLNNLDLFARYMAERPRWAARSPRRRC